MIEKKKDRTKDAPTPKAPQNRFTKNQWLNFRKFKVEKGKTMPFADWPKIYKEMSKLY